MQVQRVAVPGSRAESWTVLGDDDIPVAPVEGLNRKLSALAAFYGHQVVRRRKGGGRSALIPITGSRPLAFGCGWDVEYPRDRWRLRNLSIDGEIATISFTGIPQPWLTDLAKRWARWRLASGTGPSSVALGVRALARFAVISSPPGDPGPPGCPCGPR